MNCVPFVEGCFISVYIHDQPPLEDVDEFHAAVLVRLRSPRRDGEVGIVGIHDPIGDREIETLEVIGGHRLTGPIRQAQPILLSGYRDRWSFAALRKEVLEANAEYHGDPEQCGEGWKQLPAFDL